MWAIGGRIAGSLVTLLIVSIVLFVLVHTIPVSPARVVLGIDASEADITEFDRDHGLDKPLWQQYAAWIGGVAKGDFGKSVIDDTSISRQIADTFPVTFELVLLAFLFALVVAIPLGVDLGFVRGAERSITSRASPRGRRVDSGLLARPHADRVGRSLARLVSGRRVRALARGRPGASAIARAAGDCARALLCGDHQPHDAFVRCRRVARRSCSRVARDGAAAPPHPDLCAEECAAAGGHGGGMSFGYMFGWALIIEQVFQHRRHVARAAERDLPARLPDDRKRRARHHGGVSLRPT
jgi:peptide/nickel transport system permease protein